jgi:hypothetical protein
MSATGIKGPTHWGSKGVVDIDGGNEVDDTLTGNLSMATTRVDATLGFSL